MFNDPHGDLGDVEHLTPSDSGGPSVGGQVRTAAGTSSQLVNHHLIGLLDPPQRPALMPGLTTGPTPQGRGKVS